MQQRQRQRQQIADDEGNQADGRLCQHDFGIQPHIRPIPDAALQNQHIADVAKPNDNIVDVDAVLRVDEARQQQRRRQQQRQAYILDADFRMMRPRQQQNRRNQHGCHQRHPQHLKIQRAHAQHANQHTECIHMVLCDSDFHRAISV